MTAAKKKAAKRLGCDCWEKIDEALRPHGGKLPIDLLINTKANKVGCSRRMRVVVERCTSVKRARSVPQMVCVYCPICGKKYPKDML